VDAESNGLTSVQAAWTPNLNIGPKYVEQVVDLGTNPLWLCRLWIAIKATVLMASTKLNRGTAKLLDGGLMQDFPGVEDVVLHS
jgi:hypothetical protein